MDRGKCSLDEMVWHGKAFDCIHQPFDGIVEFAGCIAKCAELRQHSRKLNKRMKRP